MRNPLRKKRHAAYTRQLTRRRWLTAEKSHTIETMTNAHDPKHLPAPAYPPTVAHRREIPRNRNENERARIINQANDLNALSLWARRGGTKCRKNSPQVTVFSQSGEVAMLRAGQALATWQSPGREMSETNTRQPTCPQGFPAAPARLPVRSSCLAQTLYRRTRIIKALPFREGVNVAYNRNRIR